MYLYNDRQAIVEMANIYSQPEIIAKISTAENAVELQEPILRYGLNLDGIVAERMVETAKKFRSDRMRFFICLVIVLIAKVVWTLHGQGTIYNYGEEIWDAGKWTALFLGLTFMAYVPFRFFTLTFQNTVIIREAVLGLSMAYDALFAKSQVLRVVMANCTLESRHEELIHNKGYLLAHLEDLVEKAFRAMPVCEIAKDTIMADIKPYVKLIVTQYNCWDHFADNYRKTMDASLKL